MPDDNGLSFCILDGYGVEKIVPKCPHLYVNETSLPENMYSGFCRLRAVSKVFCGILER